MSETRTAPIKFTGATVREVAARAKKITNGLFALEGTGSDLVNGVRYIDAQKALTWYGPEGAREACAYYIGGALETVRQKDGEIPADDAAYLMRVQAAYMEGPQRRKADMENWEEQGRERARAQSYLD